MVRSGKINEVKSAFTTILTNKFVLSSNSISSITGIECSTVQKILSIYLDQWLAEIANEIYDSNLNTAFSDNKLVLEQFEYTEHFHFIVLEHYKTRELLVINKKYIKRKFENMITNNYTVQILSDINLLSSFGIYKDNLKIQNVPLIQGPLKNWIVEYILDEFKDIKIYGYTIKQFIDNQNGKIIIISKQEIFINEFIERVQLEMLEMGSRDNWFYNTDRILIEYIKLKSKINNQLIKDLSIHEYFNIGRILLSNSKKILVENYYINLIIDTDNKHTYLVFVKNLEKTIDRIEIDNYNRKEQLWSDVLQYLPDYHNMNRNLREIFKDYFESRGHSILKNGRIVLSFTLNRDTINSEGDTINSDEIDTQKSDTVKIEETIEDKIDHSKDNYPSLIIEKPEVKTDFIPIQSTLISDEASVSINVGTANRAMINKNEDRICKLKSRNEVFRGVVICDGITNSGERDGEKIGGKEAAEISIEVFDEIFTSLEASNIRENFEEIIDVSVNRITTRLRERNSLSKSTFILIVTDGIKVYMSYLGDGSIIQLRSDGISASAHHLLPHKATSRHLSGYLSKSTPFRKPMIMIHNIPFLKEGVFYVLASDGMGFPSGKLPKLFAGQVIRNLVKYMKYVKSNKNRQRREIDNKIQSILDNFLISIEDTDVKDDISVGIIHLISDINGERL